MVRIHTVSPFASSPLRSFAPVRRRLFRRVENPASLGSEIESIVGHFFGHLDDADESASSEQAPSYAPRVALSESKTSYELKAELPGVAREDIELDFEDDVLVIRGRRKASEASVDEDYRLHRSELSNGEFIRRVRLGQEVDAEAAEATLKDGILSVRLPKRPEATPTRIAIGES